jgi:hypothetical protein
MVTQTPTSDLGEAAVSALLRHGAAAVLWIAWFVTRSPLEGSPSLISIVIVAGLVSLYLGWVNKPLEAALGPSYARRPHWSAVFVVPTVFAIGMLVRDLVLTGRALFNA